MTTHDDRAIPCCDEPGYVFYYNWLTENSSIKNISDSSIRTLPHLLQIKFLHSRFVGRNSGTFYSHAVLFNGICCIDRHLVVCFIAILNTEVVILYIRINIGQYQLVLNELPNDPCHFIAIQLHDGVGYFDFLGHCLVLIFRVMKNFLL
jgi:hypothetical protein